LTQFAHPAIFAVYFGLPFYEPHQPPLFVLSEPIGETKAFMVNIIIDGQRKGLAFGIYNEFADGQPRNNNSLLLA
jgi:hypothetical protein